MKQEYELFFCGTPEINQIIEEAEKMAENLAFGIALSMAVLVGILCLYKLVIKGKTKKQKFIEKAEEMGCYTQGKFVDFKVIMGAEDSKSASFRYDTYIVKYEYVVEGKKYYKKMPFSADGRLVGSYPLIVTVYYDSRKPSKAFCKEEATKTKQVRGGCLTTIFFTILTLALVYNLLLNL